MPIYEYECGSCGVIQEKIFSTTEMTVKEVCVVCGGEAPKIISQSSFVLKGPGWTSRDLKVNRERTKRHEEMGRRQLKSYGPNPGPKLKPNVEGEICNSWSDAAKLAREKGKDVSTYEAKALQEQK